MRSELDSQLMPTGQCAFLIRSTAPESIASGKPGQALVRVCVFRDPISARLAFRGKRNKAAS
jgi:hypothetical protein